MNEAVSKKKHDTLLIYTQVVDDSHPILGFFIGWVTAFAKDFTEVHVIAMQVGDYTLPGNVTVYSLGKEHGYSKPRQLVRFYRHFVRIYFRERPQFVFFHMGAIFNILAAPFFYLSRFSKTRFYWWKAHGHVNWAGKLALMFVDSVYTSTASGFAIETSKRKIIGQAVDDAKFQMGNSERSDTVVFVGRIMPVKRIEDVLDTYNLLRQRGHAFELQIIGPIGDESYFQKLQQKCDSLHIPREVFVGEKTQAELVPVYQAANFFINSSVTHSMDKTVLEAVLCGCVPVTANKAFGELLSPHGLFVPDATPETYVDCIERVTQYDVTELRQTLRAETVSSHSVHTFSKRIFG